MGIDWTLITGVLGGTFGGNVLTQLIVQKYTASQREKERRSVRAEAQRKELREAYAVLIAAVDHSIDLFGTARSLLASQKAHRARQIELGEEALRINALLRQHEQEISAIEDERDRLDFAEHPETDAARKHFQSVRAVRRVHDALATQAEAMKGELESIVAASEDHQQRADAVSETWGSLKEQVRAKAALVHQLEGDPARRFALEQLVSALGPVSGERTYDEWIAELKTRRNALNALLAGMDAA